MATGCSFTALSFYFARGNNTIGKIICETTTAIWSSLHKEYMPLPNKTQCKAIADRYQHLWNLPNCVGSIDGKHVRIQKIPGSGSTNYNYKSFHSLVLMACSDADGNFIMIETGYAGRNSDGGVFKASKMGRWLQRGGLDLPEPQALPFDEKEMKFPFYFVADEAFPLQKYLMRPFPKRTLNNRKRVYNYRLSRARRSVECSFGMMTNKFQVLLNAIVCKNEKSINSIIRSACILHNFIRKREGRIFTSTDLPTEGNIGETPVVINENNEVQIDVSEVTTANCLRDYLSYYFLKPQAALPWQWNYCVNE